MESLPESSSHRPGADPSSSPRRMTRCVTDSWLGGVASGIADHLGWPIWPLRFGFIALAAVTPLLGLVLYAALWILVPGPPSVEQAPGLEAASHQGMRQPQRPKQASAGRVIAMATVGLGLIVFTRILGLGPHQPFSWALLVTAAGVGLVWLQAEDDPPPPDSSHVTTTDRQGERRRIARLIRSEKWPEIARMVGGIILICVGIVALAVSQGKSDDLPLVAMISGLTIAGIAIVAAPWILRYQRKIALAYEEELIANTRADMAAHLHDSVLQTLALIQRQANDPKQVAALARRQERELRTWLYGEQTGPSTFKAALTKAADEVENERGTPIEVVCVGDVELSEDVSAVVQSAREAMMNAAKHSGAPLIDVYAEVEPEGEHSLIQAFIHDRGQGFDFNSVSHDRMGLRSSIIGRMERHGGTAKIRSAPGQGTEIRLEMRI